MIDYPMIAVLIEIFLIEKYIFIINSDKINMICIKAYKLFENKNCFLFYRAIWINE